MTPIIELDNVSFSYNSHPVLENVSLTVMARDFVWVVGPNGGGKTTLVKLLLGLVHPKSGSVRMFGHAPEAARQRVGYMPQHAQLDAKFPVTVMDVALMGRLHGGVAPLFLGAEHRRIALEALDMVGLKDKRRHALSELSGGQQRRLLIARALASQPELLILDEPTANLDKQIEGELFELLKQLNERLTILMVSHDPTFVSDFVDDVVCVNRHVALHPTSKMDRRMIHELYDLPMKVVRHDLGHDHDTAAESPRPPSANNSAGGEER